MSNFQNVSRYETFGTNIKCGLWRPVLVHSAMFFIPILLLSWIKQFVTFFFTSLCVLALPSVSIANKVLFDSIGHLFFYNLPFQLLILIVGYGSAPFSAWPWGISAAFPTASVLGLLGLRFFGFDFFARWVISSIRWRIYLFYDVYFSLLCRESCLSLCEFISEKERAINKT